MLVVRNRADDFFFKTSIRADGGRKFNQLSAIAEHFLDARVVGIIGERHLIRALRDAEWHVERRRLYGASGAAD